MLSNHKKCDVFTPEKISKQMAQYMKEGGSLLEPSAGKGHLLKYIPRQNKIDVYDTEKEYLSHIKFNDINSDKFTSRCSDFLRNEINETYDDIIMNPPYIKIQDLQPDYRKFLQNTFPLLNSGNIDIYMAFVIKCIKLLKDDGVMVSITPNSYLFNKSATKFREYLIKNRFIKEIIDFESEKVFANVNVYCAITIYTKESKKYLLYNNKKIYYKNIKDDFFGNTNKNTLNNIINAKNGIATLRDKIFIHQNKLYEEPCWKKIYKVSKNKINWIIYPYTSDIKIISEDIFKKNNPKTYKYLEDNKDELAKRDKGNKNYEKWYAYGRRQGLNFSKSENVLYISTMGNIDFPIYKNKPILYYSGLCISMKNNIDEGIDIDNIYNMIDNNRKFISDHSSKRSNNWFNISGSTIKKINML